MRTIATILLALTAALFLSVNAGLACECVSFTPESAYQSADAVFAGRVIEKGWFKPYVEFLVVKAWKSAISEEVTVNIKGDCGPLNFTNGESYLVYAYWGRDGYLYTSVCTKTSPLADAGEQLTYLESQSPAPVTKKFWNRNMRIGAITGASLLAFLAAVYVAMRIRRRAA